MRLNFFLAAPFKRDRTALKGEGREVTEVYIIYMEAMTSRFSQKYSAPE